MYVYSNVKMYICLVQFGFLLNLISRLSSTFSEDDVSHIAMGVGGALLHGCEGAFLCDLLDLSLRQAETKKPGDLTDAFAEVLQEQ